MIKFECSECGKKTSAPDKFAGKAARCPHCKARVVVPGPEEEEEEIIEAVQVEEPSRKAKKKPATYGVEEEEEPPKPRRRRYQDDDVDDDDDDDDDGRRRRRKKKKGEESGASTFFWIAALVLAVVFVGMTIAAVLRQEGAVAMFIVGVIPMVVGNIWLYNMARAEGYGEYIAMRFIPLYDTIFAMNRWDQAWAPCIICWIGRVFCIVAGILFFAVHKGQL